MNDSHGDRLRLSLPFTIVDQTESIHLIAGEDVRYTLDIGPNAPDLAKLLRQLDGSLPTGSLVDALPVESQSAAKAMIDELLAERVLEPAAASAELTPAAAESHRLTLVTRDDAPLSLVSLADELADYDTQTPELRVLWQNTLNYDAALDFNRDNIQNGTKAWLWVSTGAQTRGYVSPVFSRRGGSCLECLIRGFQRLSPAPQLYDALQAHACKGGEFSTSDFPKTAAETLSQLTIWKWRQLAFPLPAASVFQLHVLEVGAMSTAAYPVYRDPFCPACQGGGNVPRV